MSRESFVRRLSARQLKLFLNLYPPYVGAGVRVTDCAEDFSRWDVEMRLRPYNRNYFGTHFGGSLYSMCDPFFLLIVTKMLGDGFIVWDKEATIRFKRPGRGRVRVRFEVSREQIDELRAEVLKKRRTEPVFVAEVKDDDGQVIAEVEKRIYVRRKGPYSTSQ